MQLPERLVGLTLVAGRPVGIDLPALDQRGAATAWKTALGKGPYYVHFSERTQEPDLDQVQRLARLGEVWLDAPLLSPDAALELLIAGAARLVVPVTQEELLEAVGDSAVVHWDGSVPFTQAITAAAAHEVPILATAPLPPTDDPGVYQAPPRPWSGAFSVLYVGTPLPDDEPDKAPVDLGDRSGEIL